MKIAFNKIQFKWPPKTKKEKMTTVVVIGLLALIVIAAFLLLRPPERSAAAFCKTYNQEDVKLPKPAQGGEKFAVIGLTSSTQNPRLFADALGRLERVAPEEIRYDVKTVKAVLDKIDKDPTQAFAAGLSGVGAEANVKDWVNKHCLE